MLLNADKCCYFSFKGLLFVACWCCLGRCSAGLCCRGLWVRALSSVCAHAVQQQLLSPACCVRHLVLSWIHKLEMRDVTCYFLVTPELWCAFVIYRLRQRAALRCSGKSSIDWSCRYIISLYQIGMWLDVIMLSQKLYIWKHERHI